MHNSGTILVTVQCTHLNCKSNILKLKNLVFPPKCNWRNRNRLLFGGLIVNACLLYPSQSLLGVCYNDGNWIGSLLMWPISNCYGDKSNGTDRRAIFTCGQYRSRSEHCQKARASDTYMYTAAIRVLSIQWKGNVICQCWVPFNSSCYFQETYWSAEKFSRCCFFFFSFFLAVNIEEFDQVALKDYWIKEHVDFIVH